jgi:hypothetical protein
MCKSLYLLNSAYYFAHFILFGIILSNFSWFLPTYSNVSPVSTQTNKFLEPESPLGKGYFAMAELFLVAGQKGDQLFLLNTESYNIDFMCIVYNDD